MKQANHEAPQIVHKQTTDLHKLKTVLIIPTCCIHYYYEHRLLKRFALIGSDQLRRMAKVRSNPLIHILTHRQTPTQTALENFEKPAIAAESISNLFFSIKKDH